MTIQEAHELMSRAIPVGRMVECQQGMETSWMMDRPGDIARCLNCSIPAGKCAGACSSGSMPKAVRCRSKASEKTSRIAGLTREGWKTMDIASALGVSLAVVGYHQRKAREVGLL